MDIYSTVRRIAKLHGLSLQEVAKKAGLSTNSIYGWQSNPPSITNLTKVAKAIHVPVSKLIGEDTNKTTVDLTEDRPFTYEGRPISKEEMKIVRRLLNPKNDE